VGLLNAAGRALLRRIMVALAVSYPLLAHLAVMTGSARLTVAGVALLALLALWPVLARSRVAAGLAALLAAIAVARVPAEGWMWLPLYAPPVLGDAFLAWLFGRTLASGQVPLIERMVRLLHAPGERLDAEVFSYARTLTVAWAVLFASLGLADLLLALWATPNGVLSSLGFAPIVTVPQHLWSWFANIAEYVIVAGFLVGEYAYRRRRFPQQPFAGLIDFVCRLGAVLPRALDSVLS
jgi:uncharacterized membrane protein